MNFIRFEKRVYTAGFSTSTMVQEDSAPQPLANRAAIKLSCLIVIKPCDIICGWYTVSSA